MSVFKGLPTALQHLAAKEWWVLWRLTTTKKGKLTKPPFQARAPQYKAKSDDPSTWAPFNVALAAYNAGKSDGVGLCLLQSELGVFDLDDCRDPHNGALEPAAERLVPRSTSRGSASSSAPPTRTLICVTRPTAEGSGRSKRRASISMHSRRIAINCLRKQSCSIARALRGGRIRTSSAITQWLSRKRAMKAMHGRNPSACSLKP